MKRRSFLIGCAGCAAAGALAEKLRRVAEAGIRDDPAGDSTACVCTR